MRRLVIGVLLLLAAGVSLGLFLTRAAPLPREAVAGLTGDAEAGETVFHAAGCASCHTAPGSEGEAKRILAGGQRFPSEFGTFVAPNISLDPVAGIGNWTIGEFASAVTRGVSPDRAHYYPAFPFTSYALMTPQDVVDLWAFLQTLPPSDAENARHELSFPFNIRRSLAVWKFLNGPPDWVIEQPPSERGRYLVEALAHCGECHTPRDGLGRLDRSRWMAGAPNPSGKGRIPGITPAQLDWAEADIAYYLETGFTPDFDSAGGHMASVITNMSQLSAEDRAHIAAYVKALPPAQ